LSVVTNVAKPSHSGTKSLKNILIFVVYKGPIDELKDVGTNIAKEILNCVPFSNFASGILFRDNPGSINNYKDFLKLQRAQQQAGGDCIYHCQLLLERLWEKDYPARIIVCYKTETLQEPFHAAVLVPYQNGNDEGWVIWDIGLHHPYPYHMKKELGYIAQVSSGNNYVLQLLSGARACLYIVDTAKSKAQQYMNAKISFYSFVEANDDLLFTMLEQQIPGQGAIRLSYGSLEAIVGIVERETKQKTVKTKNYKIRIPKENIKEEVSTTARLEDYRTPITSTFGFDAIQVLTTIWRP
jgi:hypothetical protein